MTNGQRSHIWGKAAWQMVNDPTYGVKQHDKWSKIPHMGCSILDTNNLEETIQLCRMLSERESDVNKVYAKKYTKQTHVNHKTTTPSGATCGHCGGSYPHQGQCPAYGLQCHSCNKANHFARCCRAKTRNNPPSQQYRKVTNKFNQNGRQQSNQKQKVNKLSTPAPTGSDNEYVYVIGSMNSNQHPRRKVTINEHSVELLIDSGSNVNILDRSTFDRICGDLPVEPVRKDIRAYASNEPLPIVGRVTTKVTARSNTTLAQFYVVDGKHGCILGYETSTELGILHVANAVTKEDHANVESQHPELFEGLGKLKESCIKLHIDPDVIPVAQNHRRIPFHMRRKVEDELVWLEDLDIIEKVDGPTPWVSPIVVVPKPKSPNEVRICVDMRIPNTAIQRERHITPTLDDILCDLNGATVFSKLDLNNGYHQLELHEESRYITTFSTHCVVLFTVSVPMWDDFLLQQWDHFVLHCDCLPHQYLCGTTLYCITSPVPMWDHFVLLTPSVGLPICGTTLYCTVTVYSPVPMWDHFVLHCIYPTPVPIPMGPLCIATEPLWYQYTNWYCIISSIAQLPICGTTLYCTVTVYLISTYVGPHCIVSVPMWDHFVLHSTYVCFTSTYLWTTLYCTVTVYLISTYVVPMWDHFVLPTLYCVTVYLIRT